MPTTTACVSTSFTFTGTLLALNTSNVPVGAAAPVLTLAGASRLLSSTPQAVQTAERREAGRGLVGRERGTMTLASLLARADAYGLDLEVRVRPRRG